jgi:hypothetical protein
MNWAEPPSLRAGDTVPARTLFVTSETRQHPRVARRRAAGARRAARSDRGAPGGAVPPRAFPLYRSRDGEGALEALQVCRSLEHDFGLEGLLDLYRARVQAFSEVAPPSDWNGVFVAETK